MKFTKRTPAPEKSLPIDAAAVERLRQFAMLAEKHSPGGGRARVVSCNRCGRAGEDMTIRVGRCSFVAGAGTLAVGNDAEVLIGTFEPVIERHESSGVAVAVGTKLIGPPVRKSGKVEIVCTCGHRRQWHTPAG